MRLRSWSWPLGVAALLGLIACVSHGLGGLGETCDNGVDDDGDGWVDCADPDCTQHPVCTGEHVCGDGLVTGPEDCEGSNPLGMSCGEIFPGAQGPLYCGADCTWDTSECLMGPDCGNGIREFGEECDCGLDLMQLPAGCLDVNGGAAANCTASCEQIDVCGDGIRTGMEECDCGTDPVNLPPGCFAENGSPDGMCSDSCLLADSFCEAELWDECNPLNEWACCPDDWEATTVCNTLGSGDYYCLRGCSATADCYWSNQCYLQLGGICYPAVCGPSYAYEDMNAFCEVSGGGSGWCTPLYDRVSPNDEQYGVCLESGTLQHGDSCQGHGGLLQQDRSVSQCALGVCLQTNNPAVGICRQLCDWEAAYEAAIYGLSGEVLPCPAGANCINYAHLDPATGVRTGDLGYCLEQGAMNHPQSATTCSLITGQLLADPGTLCADFIANGRCHMIQLAAGDMANGTLVGVCGAGPTPNRMVWDPCDPAMDVCPQGAACRAQDFFAPSPAGPTRCLPLCDAQFHTAADCLGMGAPEPATCRSLSERFAPADLSPTRLGLCTL